MDGKTNHLNAKWTVDQAFEIIRSSRSCLVFNIGNAGDGLIALGTYLRLKAEGISIPIIPLSLASEVAAFDLVVFGGGGQLVPPYRDGLHFLQHCASKRKSVIVLPHTVNGYGSELREISDRLHICCREQMSYNGLLKDGYPEERLGLDHDMALSIPPGHFIRGRNAVGYGTGLCLRTDGESARENQLPISNRDISLSWNGDLWHNEKLTSSVCQSLVDYIIQFQTIETDRLHIAILSAMLGRQTNFSPNSYYKNRAVYEFSLKDRFKNISFNEKIFE